ncbi:gamma-butyrobetaine dioxygenase-like [Toxorhynchites rutilus septentrionalis]|uniref:gamma-butyrobetaine dioxygenase-like n=1 Tax=Toxorhynchites rutilus septentrionalis TaxID=329112 RepID=UPI0024785E01|nr:gamma-butyrobetaine dioxygenase-like [Toxorhynchites rutilus septentrionalis]
MALRTFRTLHKFGSSLIKVERNFASSSAPLSYLSSQPFRALHTETGGKRKAASVGKPQPLPCSSVRPLLIRSANLSDGDESTQPRRHLAVELTDGNRYKFPLVWLRDNCQCSECFHPGSHSRILNWESFDVDGVELVSCTVANDGSQVDIVWSDGHRSHFGCEWLLQRRFTDASGRDYLREWYRPPPQLWGREDFKNVISSFEFSDVINCDEALQSWIEALVRYGTVMIRNAPLTELECRRLAERVGFIRKTHYGEEFIVKAKEGTSNVAYLSTPLQMHTDLPYYDYKPGCNLLHCLVQSRSEGGQNLIADAFFVADMMRRDFPAEYQTLTETLINWTDIGEDAGGQFHSIYRAPVICIGRDGNLERINHSVPQRDSFFNVQLDRVEPWYRAMSRFVQLIHREAVAFKTAPGDILTFSNVRMVHGRTGYTDTDVNTRHIVGAYLDWDEIYSKLRVLKARVLK